MHKKERKILIPLLILSVALNIMYVPQLVKKSKSSKDLIVYNLDVRTENLNIKDLTLVRFDNQVYIQKGYIFEQQVKDKKIDNIQMRLCIDGQAICDIAQKDAFFKSDEFSVPTFTNASNIEFTNSPKLSVLIKYTENDEKKEFTDTFDLNNQIINN